MIAYVDNDNLVRGTKLRTVSLATGETEYLSEMAVVTMTVVDSEGVELVGQTWPVTLAYVPDSEGTFLGVLRNELEWEDAEQWYAVVTVDNGPDQHGEFTLPIDVQTRTL